MTQKNAITVQQSRYVVGLVCSSGRVEKTADSSKKGIFWSLKKNAGISG
jgi:hypothetical protein